MIRPLGVDITHRVGTVQWRAARLAGVTFACIKATDGSEGTNPRFNEYWRGAADAGILRGAYHCFQPHLDPHEQARWFTRHAPPGELPPAVVLDLEGDLPADALERLRSFLEDVTALTGRVPLLQADFSRWTLAVLALGDLEEVSWARDYPLWVVSYFTRSPDPPFPWPSLKWTFWRFSQRGDTRKYGAQSRYINLNLFNGTLAGLRRLHPMLETAAIVETQQAASETHLPPVPNRHQSYLDDLGVESWS
jgi:lysozyme